MEGRKREVHVSTASHHHTFNININKTHLLGGGGSRLLLGLLSVLNFTEGSLSGSSTNLRLLSLLLLKVSNRHTNDGTDEFLSSVLLLLLVTNDNVLLVKTSPGSSPVDQGRLLSEVVEASGLGVGEGDGL